jgi:hemolysin activation/secretion protein
MLRLKGTGASGLTVKKFLLLACLAIALTSHAALAQVGGLHILGTGELAVPAAPQSAQAPPATPIPVAPPQLKVSGFILKNIVIDGASSVPPGVLATAWAPAIGHPVNSADLSIIAQRIGDLEGKADIALYAVSFPQQTIENGIVHIRVVEISVVHVVITGDTKGQKLGLIQGYAQNILASKPLLRSVLERNVLLMGDIPGTKVGSQFVPVPGHPDAVQLVLAVQPKMFEGGFSLNNQGTPLLDNTQAVFNAAVNNLFHEGEQTQFVLGLPLDVTRYQYYGVNDTESLGPSGLSLALSAGELVSHSVDHGPAGAATLLSIRLQDPVVRAVHTNIVLSGGLDAINSDNAYLGFTTSDERTRSLRLAASYNDDKYFQGIDNFGASVSEGLYLLGARQAGPAYGKPDFTKGNFNLERVQLLPYDFVLRLAASGQFTADRLPPSEEFTYGGPEFGAAFFAAELEGDEGIDGLAQLAHQIPATYLPKQLAGTSIFALADYGRIWNRNTIYAVPTDRAGSFAAGIKLVLFNKFALQLGAATPIIKPEYVPHSERWRFIIATSGHF